MRIPRPRRRWLVLAGLVILVIASVRALDRPMLIDSYRVIDSQTLGVETITGPGSWTRVTGVTEKSSSVTITVSSLDVPFVPRSDVGQSLELTVKLSAPIGKRTVVDGSSGETVEVTACPPFMWQQGSCPGQSSANP
jgi:hypothetical protein